MSPKERLSVNSIALIYSFRMLGLFMIYPTFSVFAQHLHGSTPFLIGLALGIYGLTQACLQIPFGTLSDSYGRKPILFLGLAIFALGSVIAANSHSMSGIIFGRAVQGAGAVGSTLTALVADSTRDEHRLKAMAIIGITIGISFCIALVLGPLFTEWVGISGIFAITAGLAIIAMLILWLVVPTAKQIKHYDEKRFSMKKLQSICKNTELMRLNAGIFLLHATLTAVFLAIPLTLLHSAHLAINMQWLVYLPVLVLSFFAMIPFVIIAEVKQKMKQVLIGSVLTLAISQGLLWPLHGSAFLTAVLLFFYFTAFILLESTLPSLVSKIAPLANKGAALGVFSTSQFLGIFFGGIIGGFVLHGIGTDGLFVFAMILALIWLLLVSSMPIPRHLSTKIYHLSPEIDHNNLKQQLNNLEGVIECVIDKLEHTVYLKVDRKHFNETNLNELLKQGEHHG